MKHIFIKISSLFMILTLLTTVLFTFVGAESITEFSDVTEDYWGYKTIMDMTKKGIFKGTTQAVNGVGTFSPENVMTRSEFITASLRSVYPDETKSIENDSSKWWNGYYLFAQEKGIVKNGELDGGDLDKAITREEMAMIMVRCVSQKGEKTTQKIKSSQIPDYSQIGEYYKEYVIDCFSFGLICGIDENGTFAPSKSLTRAEAATVICRLLDKNMRVKVDFVTESESGSTNSKNDQSLDDFLLEPEMPILPAEPKPEPLPWENGGKKPGEYTFEEFEALPDTQKDAFIGSFGSVDAFTRWMEKAQNNENAGNELPWENGGKKPSEYTFEEFEALPDTQKDAFIGSFGSVEAFSQWMEKANQQSVNDKLPWENGGKKPNEYTFEEFEALPDTQKDAFIGSFGNMQNFTDWMNKVKE